MVLGSWLGKIDKSVVTDLAIPFAKNDLPELLSKKALNAASNTIKKFEKRITGKGAVRAVKGFTLFILNDTDDIIKTVKSLEDSGVLIDGVIEAVKHEIKKTRRWISWYFVSTFSCFSGTICDFFIGIKYYWKRSYDSRKRIL